MMSQKQVNVGVLIAWLILCILIVFSADLYTHESMRRLMNKNLTADAMSMRQKAEILIEKKNESMIPVGLALAQSSQIKDALIQNNPELLKLEEFSSLMRINSRYKNVWFQVIDREGNSFYRNWISKRGDNLLKARIDVAKMVEEPKIMSSISTGKFDMTHKAMIPIFNNTEFIGIIEILTHFNSIAQELLESNIDAVFIVDKKYKKQLTNAFTKLFINDYYIANYNAKTELLKQIEKNGVEKYINLGEAFLYDEEENQLITTLRLPDINGDIMSYVILSKHTDKQSNILETAQVHRENTIYIVFLLIIISILGYLIVNMKYSSRLRANYNALKAEKEKISTIINTQPAIIIITDGRYIQDVNLKFFQFFNQYNSLEAFKKEHDCICDCFDTNINDAEYINQKDGWVEKVLANETNTLKVAILKDNALHHFLVKGAQRTLSNGETLTIISFFDITEQIKKDQLILRQSKNAAMGEMIDAIAHQWKNPLVVITGYAELISMDTDSEKMNPEEIREFSNKILEQSNLLHETLQEFRSFFRPNTLFETVSIKSIVTLTTHLLNDQLIKNRIKIVDEKCQNVKVHLIPNEFKHVLINLISNSIDAYNDNTLADDNRERSR